MDEIRIDYGDSQIQIVRVAGQRLESSGIIPRNLFPPKVNFYRNGNNFGYVGGTITFSNDCDNNLVISDQNHTTISETKNALIIIKEGKVKISPIEDTESAYTESEGTLKSVNIAYRIPESVLIRERLSRKNSKDLERTLVEEYSLHPTQLREIGESVKRNGLFYVSDGASEYVFKYFGKDDHKLRAIFNLTSPMPDLFPVIRKTENRQLGVILNGEIYGLEEFVSGQTQERDHNYFTLLGGEIAKMHERFSELIERNPELRTQFLTDTKYLSDSNLVSLYIDLTCAGFIDLIGEVKQFSKLEVNKEVNNLPEQLIHGDLNSSNVICTDQGLRFIDLERIKISKRILEFESPLIFGGNMEVPIYLKGSLHSLVNGYNSTAKDPLNNHEMELSIAIIRYALIKNFVIRNIRRREENNTKKNLLENLSLLLDG